MSGIVEALLKLHNWKNSVSKQRARLVKTASPVRLGVLSTAAINFTAIFDPISTHPDVVVVAVASRSESKAQAQIDKYGLDDYEFSGSGSGSGSGSRTNDTHKNSNLKRVKAYGSYDALIADPEVDAVYISLPNGMHCEWTVKCLLQGGKHVLVEKPIASNAQEARQIRDAAVKANKVVLEAFHWRFHPAAHFVKELVTRDNQNYAVEKNTGVSSSTAVDTKRNGTDTTRKDYGNVEEVNVKFLIPAGSIGKNDIRFQYDIGGGSCMDAAYVFSALAYFATSNGDVDSLNSPAYHSGEQETNSQTRQWQETKFVVEEAIPRLNSQDRKIDEAMKAVISITQNNTTEESGDSTLRDQGPRGSEGKAVKCTIETDLALPPAYGVIPRYWEAMPSVTIECTRARVHFSSFAGPWLGHTITITEKDEHGKLIKAKTRKEKLYVGGPEWTSKDAVSSSSTKFDDTDGTKRENGTRGQEWWTTYRYQLEAFVDRIRAVEARADHPPESSKANRSGSELYSGPWVSLEESIWAMSVVDAVYSKAGLPVRGIDA